MYVLDVTGKLVVDYRAREWCKLPYPGPLKRMPKLSEKYSVSAACSKNR